MSAKVDFLRDLAQVLEKHNTSIDESGLLLWGTIEIEIPPYSSANDVLEMADQIEKQEKGGG